MSDPIRHRIARDFPPEVRDRVERALGRYGTEDYHREVGRVRMAVLDLVRKEVAQGKLEGDAEARAAAVERFVEDARLDYRDVLYWAYYLDDDPFWRLTALIEGLVDAGKLTDADAYRIRNTAGVTDFHGIFVLLCGELTERGLSVDPGQREAMEWLAGRLGVPPAVWRRVGVE